MTGAELIAQERQRQIEEEGWTIEGDVQKHSEYDLAFAAMCYACPYPKDKSGPVVFFKSKTCPIMWPWDAKWWKPTPNDRKRELVKAGALIAAEIDRLQSLGEE